MSESQCSFRSMEILSPEPPVELEIPLESDSENPSKSVSQSKSRKSPSPKSKTPQPPKSPRKTSARNNRPKSKKKSEKTLPIDPKKTPAEIKLEMKNIEKNDSAISDLLKKYDLAKEETEICRRENAEGFYALRHLIGKKGESLLQNMYFDHYPHLNQIENPTELVSIENTIENDLQSEISLDQSDDRIFYQTELSEKGKYKFSYTFATYEKSVDAKSSAILRKNVYYKISYDPKIKLMIYTFMVLHL